MRLLLAHDLLQSEGAFTPRWVYLLVARVLGQEAGHLADWHRVLGPVQQLAGGDHPHVGLAPGVGKELVELGTNVAAESRGGREGG